MAYKPYNPYSSDKEPTRLRFLPFILFGGIILGIALVGHDAYKHAHPRPKPVVAEPQIIPYTKLAAGRGTGGVCVYRQGEGWICGDPALSHPKLSHAFEVTPRKHRRKVDEWEMTFKRALDLVSPPYESWSFINTIPAQINCTRITKTSGMHCESRPLTPAEVEQYKPLTENSKPTGDTQAQYWGTGGSKEPCTKDNTTHCLDISEDGDVQRTKIVPDCLYGGSVDGSIRPCTADDNLTIHLNPSKPLDPKPYSQDTVWPTFTGTAQIQLTEKQKDAYASNAWMKPCGPDNHADSCFIPFKLSCVMPADIDVCPVQMLEPKAANDSSSSLTVAAALMTCVIQPDATPIINLKSGPTPVPCATLKWATDAVDADKKKASHD